MVGMAFVKSWVGLVICRALLGVFESTFNSPQLEFKPDSDLEFQAVSSRRVSS